MSTDSDGKPFRASAPHCGVCEHVYFLGDWNRSPYCARHDRPVSITVGDVCSAFSLRRELDTAAPEEDIEVEWETVTGGTEAPFYPTYRAGERHGLFCSNCETDDVSVGPMGRIVCNQCENSFRPSDWDRAYL